MHPMISLVCTYLILLSSKAGAIQVAKKTRQSKFSIGAIVDNSSRVGREEMTAIRMAVDDYYKYANKKPSLYIKDSGHDPTSMATAAHDLINRKQVGVVLGFRMCKDFAFISELGNKAQVPVLSFADITPLGVSKKSPFLIQATHKDYKQMRAVAALVGTWKWRNVVVIYEDANSARLSIPHLVDALREVGSNIHFLTVPSLTISVAKKLEKLAFNESRLFIVHTSLAMADHLFKEANKMELMENSLWIITNSISDLIDAVDESVISTMQGILGVKSHFPQNGIRFKSFKSRFRSRFRLDHPESESLEPGIFALQAYDATWAVAEAMKIMGGSADPGRRLLKNLLLIRFEGLTGDFHFIEGELAPSSRFDIINVYGKSYKELGHWTAGKGFSKSVDGATVPMSILGQVQWPEGPMLFPWTLPTRDRRLRIGVPYYPPTNPFINVIDGPDGEPIVNGFSINVFDAVRGQLPYDLPYDFLPCNGSYDSLVEQVHHKNLDAIVGDMAILANRSKYVEFSQPWSDSGLQMVYFQKSSSSDRAWLFFKPFTTVMWVLTAVVTIYNGFIVWFMERMHHPEFNGSTWNKVGSLIWLAFSTLFSLHGDRLHSNLSRMTMVVWLFVAIIIIQSYTASLASMLTIPRFQSKHITVDDLRTSNVKVGCDNRSFVIKYLETVLSINSENIVRYNSQDMYAEALIKGEIEIAFLEVPYVRVLLARNCRNFAVYGETFSVGGFGFVFQKGSPILPDINNAILKLKETRTLKELEHGLISCYNCSDTKYDGELDRLGLTSFWGLFLITVGTSTIALMLHLLQLSKSSKASIHESPTYNEHDPSIDEKYMFASEMQINN